MSPISNHKTMKSKKYIVRQINGLWYLYNTVEENLIMEKCFYDKSSASKKANFLNKPWYKRQGNVYRA